MNRQEDKGRSDLLYETILELKDLDECRRFFSLSLIHISEPTRP